MQSLMLIYFLFQSCLVLAFPAEAMEGLIAPMAPRADNTGPSNPPQGAGALPLVPPPFDAASQYVSTTGPNRFIPPGPGDQRGPCPGLNALANHGYLPRNGIATTQQFIQATETVYGMAVDLAGFLAVYGAILDGPLTSFSIAGLPHTGISGSHNNYESDNSAFKGDLNQYGNNVNLVMEQFMKLYNLQTDAATANYNLDVFRQHRKNRLQESISKNPYFVYTPFAGLQVAQAGYAFQYRFMGNKSAEYPEGVLNKEVLKSFNAISGPENNLQHTPGHERIPDNWYKRNNADQFSIPYLQSDLLFFAELEPEIFTIGCNQGRVNSYNAINVTTLTAGAYTASQVLQSPLCFSMEFAIAELPVLTGLSSTQLGPLTTLLTEATASMNCKAIGEVNTTAFTLCPGFTQYGGPTGPIAPGAIQS